jgi:hypothetical protein
MTSEKGREGGKDPRQEEKDAKRREDAAKRQPSGDLPAAGPHADPALMNPDATPGAGTVTPPGQHGDGDSTSG